MALQGKGLFTRVSDKGSQSQADLRTWIMTPKYGDPFAADADRKMAKFIIDADLAKIINKVTGGKSAAGDDNVYANLIKENRGYFDFFLQNVEESIEDKFQLVETLGDSYAIFGLGQKPKIFNYSGMLLNSQENDWRLGFIKMYDKYISISRLAKFRQDGLTSNQVTLVYDSVTVRGALLNLRTSLRADNEIAVPFAFSMLITSYIPNASVNVIDSGIELNSVPAGELNRTPLNKVNRIQNGEQDSTLSRTAYDKKSFDLAKAAATA